MKHILEYDDFVVNDILNEEDLGNPGEIILGWFKEFKKLLPFNKGFSDVEARQNFIDWAKRKKLPEYAPYKDEPAPYHNLHAKLKDYLSDPSTLSSLTDQGNQIYARDEQRSKIIKIIAIVGSILIIIGAIGGSIMTLKSLLIARWKRKNKELTGHDRLTHEQEEKAYKILVISKCMVIIGGIGGALRIFKFLLSGFYGKNDWSTGDIGTVISHAPGGASGSRSHETPDDNEHESIQIYNNEPELNEQDGRDVEKLLILLAKKNQGPVNKVIDKIRTIAKQLPTIIKNLIQSKSRNIEEDLVIECAKVNQIFKRIFGPAEKQTLLKLGENIHKELRRYVPIKENNEYSNYEILNERDGRNVEKLLISISKTIPPDKIDSILRKVWDNKMEADINTINNTNDENEAIIKTMEIKKSLNIKLDQPEKQILLQLGENMGKIIKDMKRWTL